MSLIKHSHYETFGDLGIFNQGIWQYSQFKWPIISFHINGPFLGDHFHPILASLAPLYWLWPSEKVLLVIQPFIILSALIPLFLISYRLTKSIFFSLSIMIGYSFYIPLQYTIFYDFHEIVFLPPLFAWVYWFFINNKKLLVTLFLIACLLVKEDVGFFVAAFGLYLFLFIKDWRRFGLIWVIGGIGYSLAVIGLVIPALSMAAYRYSSLSLSLPILDDIKRETIRRTFYPFGFLPLLSPLALILSAEQFLERFANASYPVAWTIGYHYSAPMAIIVALGAITTAAYCGKRKIFLILFGLLIITLTRIDQINRSAVLLVKRQIFWARADWMDGVDEALALVPPNVSVSSQNNLISHVSGRKEVYTLTDMDKAQYLLLDFHPGQSAYNFLGQKEWDKVEKEVKEGIRSGKYEIVYNKGEVFLLRLLTSN